MKIEEEIERVLIQELTPKNKNSIREGYTINSALTGITATDYVCEDPEKPFKQELYSALTSLRKKWGYCVRLEYYPTRTGGIFTVLISKLPMDDDGARGDVPQAPTSAPSTQPLMAMSAAAGRH